VAAGPATAIEESIMSVRALVLTGFGINCDRETAYAFEQAGAEAIRMHLNDLVDHAALLERFHVLAIPGGFSFGDDVASGKILANRLRNQLGPALREFVEAGKLAVGICNGFQVMVKMGLLPFDTGQFEQRVTLTHNDSGRFEDRWVHLATEAGTPCVWLEGLDRFESPVRHGEGKFVARDSALLAALEAGGQVALRYAAADGGTAGGAYPANPNGSEGDVAGICDPTGRLFGLMPHPEAFLCRTNHPRWTREPVAEPTPGTRMFQNAVAFAHRNLL